MTFKSSPASESSQGKVVGKSVCVRVCVRACVYVCCVCVCTCLYHWDLSFNLSSWDALHTQCAARGKELEQALEKAKSFHGNRKAELDWLDGAEKNLSATDKVHGLPNTCAKDLEDFEFLQEEVACHAEPVQALSAEGDGLKPQGNAEEQQQVKNWTGVVKQRWVGQ